MSTKSRVTKIKLNSEDLEVIAKNLGINDANRLPTELVINAISLDELVKTMPRGLALPRGVAVIDVIA
jgi:hypothetical protein